MSLLNDAFNSVANLRLWYKLQGNDALMLGDISELIAPRWSWLRDKWNFLRPDIINRIDASINPEKLRTQIDDFTSFIELQRYSAKQNNPLTNRNTFFRFQELWDNIEIGWIAPTNEENKIIEQIRRRVRAFTRNDFIAIRSALEAARDEYSDTVSGTDEDYNRIYNRSAVPALKTLAPADIQQIQYFQDAIKSCEFILANAYSLSTTTVDPFALAKANANNPDYDVQSSMSGSMVRMQYGDDLKDIAQRYLGDPDRWIEIAIANGLKPPYIDEVGEKILLITNGSSNQINIAITDGSGTANIDKLYVNQIVMLQSDLYPFPDQRTVIGIREIPISGEIIIDLSGELDLNKFKLVDNASMRIFKPNTINSQFYMMIPSTGASAPQPLNDTPWFLKAKKEDEKQAGVDLMINRDGDIEFSSTGDIALSYGLANALQAVQLKFVSERGTLNRHDDYGLINVLGNKTTTGEAQKQALTTAIVDMIEADPRFSAVVNLQVTSLSSNNTSGFLVQLVVRLAGTGTAVPISFTVNPS